MSLKRETLEKAETILSDADSDIAALLEEAWQEGYDEGYTEGREEAEDAAE